MSGVRKPRLGCEHCRNEPEPGWIETDNNGPIMPCRCNPVTEKDLAWDRAEAQRNAQRRSTPVAPPAHGRA